MLVKRLAGETTINRSMGINTVEHPCATFSCEWPPPINVHNQSPIVGTSPKQQPPGSDCDNFLSFGEGLQFSFVLNLLQTTSWHIVWPLCPLCSKSVLGFSPLECLVTIWNYACCHLEIASSNSLPKGKCFGTFSLMRPLGFDSPKQPLIFHCGWFLRGGLTVVVSSKWKASFCQGWCG